MALETLNTSEYTTTLSSNKPIIDYVTCAQGQVYIGHVLVDECYDIQYAYRELKEPIYGYNSKFYDEILPGTVIVHGEFSINYKHDQYLQKMMSKIAGDNEGDATTRYQTARTKKAENEDKALIYKTLLGNLKSYSDALDKETERKRNLEGQLALAKAKSDAADNLASTQKDDIEKQIVKAEKDYSDWFSSLSTTDADIAREALLNLDKSQDLYLDSKDVVSKSAAQWDALVNKCRAAVDAINTKIGTYNSELRDLDKALSGPGLTPSDVKDITTKKSEIVQNIADEFLKLEKANADLTDARKMASEGKVSDARALQETKDSISNSISDGNGAEIRFEAIRLQTVIRQLKLKLISEKQGYGFASIGLKGEISRLEAELAKIDLTGLKQSISNGIETIRTLKSTMEDVNQELIDAYIASKGEMAPSPKRAEDFPVFDIYLYYNNVVNKIITGCSITGHIHVVNQGGEPIREYFTFVAKTVQ